MRQLRRRMRIRGGSASILAISLLTAAVGTGIAAGHDSGGASASDGNTKRQTVTAPLKTGSRGRSVKLLQRRMGQKADGIFGRKTRAAVRRTQKRHKLVVDGIAGTQTLTALGFRVRSRTASDRTRSGRRYRRPPRRARRVLERIAKCESGGNPRAVSPGGDYRGKYQFSMDTWRSVGGRGDPVDASEREQDYRAYRLYKRSGTAPWPSCG